ncbi:MAG: tungstate ABC transporter substrate-binding protein WtpA [Actinomycetes bacterium]
MLSSIHTRARPSTAAALAAAVLLVALGLVIVGCGSDKRQVKLMYAGSLIVPFEQLAAEFERSHPDVDVLTESHGSIQVLRHVTELGDRFDLAVSADEQLIPPLMYDRVDHETGEPYASWYCTFATNRMVLAISPKSPLAGELDARTWYRRLTQPDVRFGLADPRFDAAGYRALMLLQLAEREYDDPYLFEDMMMGRFTTPVTVTRNAGGVDVIEVPEILETQSGGNLVLRGASIQLVALLESGDLDCAFEYESVARQHGLEYVRLPSSIDLGEAGRRADYRRVEVKLDFRRFASVKPVFRGDVIRYAFTIPANAPEPGLAGELAAFLLGDDGRRILEEDHQPVLTPPRLDNASAAPEEVRRACGGSR